LNILWQPSNLYIILLLQELGDTSLSHWTSTPLLSWKTPLLSWTTPLPHWTTPLPHWTTSLVNFLTAVEGSRD